jgi:hypothetical protein
VDDAQLDTGLRINRADGFGDVMIARAMKKEKGTKDF